MLPASSLPISSVCRDHIEAGTKPLSARWRLGQRPNRLDAWLERATTSVLQALQRFAKGLGEDYDAVKAGVTLPWSTSPVEGHINRLKMLKRQMFGRARLDLLSRRFLGAPESGQGRAQSGAVAA